MIGVVLFPGSNCEQDAIEAVRHLGGDADLLWHGDDSVGDADAVIVPGGFSFGDHLRCGALAALSPAMAAVRAHAEAGGPVLGVCNGFQVLTEAGLLPGILRPNASLRFRCHDAALVVERESPWLPGASAGDRLTIPIKHHDGGWYAPPEQVAEIERRGQVLLRYEQNPNGSVGSIACVVNERGNVAGLMPHPEHAVDELLGSTHGRVLLQGLLDLAPVPVPA